MSLSIYTGNRVKPFYSGDTAAEVSQALTILLADTFALYLKTKSFHWHMAPTGFGIFQPLLDEQAEQILSITDVIAQRISELGGTTLHSIGRIGRLQRLADNDADCLTPAEMLTELASDNRQLSSFLRSTRDVCDVHRDFETADYFETWIDEADGRTWFLVEAWRAHLRSIPTPAAALQMSMTVSERLMK
jgi:starvation-inducible DNA-binding protein